MENLSMQFAGRLKELSSYDRDYFKKSVQRFLSKQSKFVDNGELKLVIKQRSEKFRNLPLFFCRANFFTDKGVFTATGEEYGVNQCINLALHKVKRQLLKRKNKN